MEFEASHLAYAQTGYFSKIVLDYLQQDKSITPFYDHAVTIDGIKAAIANRQKFATDRNALVSILQQQYASVTTSNIVQQNIQLLADENTFTICTAHQPNIFTGPLYFIYKILHAAKLAAYCKEQLPAYNFVPVYYMGSEDADIDELGHIYVDGEKYTWSTKQTGAVGRMKVDKDLLSIIDNISGRLSVLPYGAEIIALMKDAYTIGTTLEQATFHLTNTLFKEYGVVVFLPDNAAVKAAFSPVIKRELLESFSHKEVEKVTRLFPEGYKVQASGRDINMFHLSDGKRGRIELKGDIYEVVDTDKKFTKDELVTELNEHPESFSPNVILRPVLQEWLLPGIAFVGGGGEIAYWLQLKEVFKSCGVPYPMLVVRNSLMVVDKQDEQLRTSLNIEQKDIFSTSLSLMNALVKRESLLQLSLEKELKELEVYFTHLQNVVARVDKTLEIHTNAMFHQTMKKIQNLEKKIIRAEKRKFEAQQRKLEKLKAHLFPNNNLQERIQNIMPLYAKWGSGFIQALYDHSLALDASFTILTEA